MPTLDECFAQNQGKALLVPGGGAGNEGQCVQWADTVLHDVCGFPYVYANAIDWWSNPQVLQNFTQITDGSIRKGDFVIFNSSVGSVYGHISVAMGDATIDNFTSSDSNWGGNKTVHLVNHVGRQYVIGSLRLKNMEPVFNEGDRVNINNALYGYDKGFFKTTVGRPWKDSMYAILQSDDFKNENNINTGDVKNINSVLGGDASVILGRVWKEGTYNYILKNSGGTYTPVTEQLYERKK